MNRIALVMSVALALAMSAAPSVAQMQGAPGQAPGAQPQTQKGEHGPGQKGAEKSEPKGKSEKGTAQGREPTGKSVTQTEPGDKAPKGSTQKSVEPKDKAPKGTTEKRAEPKDKAIKGAAEKGIEPEDKATKGTAEMPKHKAGTGNRVQLSEQQRTNVSQTILKDRNVNRVNNVNISINVGTRVPRSVRLVALPATVISLVPDYRSYRYFVVDDRICIVEPDTYEVVDIITVSGQTARIDNGGAAVLVLTDEERAIILSEVDMSSGSTLGLGALTEGAEVPRGVEVRVFPERVVQKVPKVRGYKFFTTENRLAIVDSQGAKVRLVIEERR